MSIIKKRFSRVYHIYSYSGTHRNSILRSLLRQESYAVPLLYVCDLFSVTFSVPKGWVGGKVGINGLNVQILFGCHALSGVFIFSILFAIFFFRLGLILYIFN